MPKAGRINSLDSSGRMGRLRGSGGSIGRMGRMGRMGQRSGTEQWLKPGGSTADGSAPERSNGEKRRAEESGAFMGGFGGAASAFVAVRGCSICDGAGRGMGDYLVQKSSPAQEIALFCFGLPGGRVRSAQKTGQS